MLVLIRLCVGIHFQLTSPHLLAPASQGLLRPRVQHPSGWQQMTETLSAHFHALLPGLVCLFGGVAVAATGEEEAQAAASHVGQNALGLFDISINLQGAASVFGYAPRCGLHSPDTSARHAWGSQCFVTSHSLRMPQCCFALHAAGRDEDVRTILACSWSWASASSRTSWRSALITFSR